MKLVSRIGSRLKASSLLTTVRCFMFMGHVDGIVLYKHRDTRRYLNIDAATGRFYQYIDGDYIEINREQAIEHVYGSRQI